jgi:hypothetical protein
MKTYLSVVGRAGYVKGAVLFYFKYQMWKSCAHSGYSNFQKTSRIGSRNTALFVTKHRHIGCEKD